MERDDGDLDLRRERRGGRGRGGDGEGEGGEGWDGVVLRLRTLKPSLRSLPLLLSVSLPEAEGARLGDGGDQNCANHCKRKHAEALRGSDEERGWSQEWTDADCCHLLAEHESFSQMCTGVSPKLRQ